MPLFPVRETKKLLAGLGNQEKRPIVNAEETVGIEPAKEPHRSRGGSLKRWLRLLVVVVVTVGLGATVHDAVQQLREQPEPMQVLTRLPLQWIGVAAVLYAAALLPPAMYWHRVLRAFGQPVYLQRSVAAHVLGQLGKYVPGKAMVVVMRTAAVRGPGVSMPIAAVAVFVETLCMMASGATLAGVIIGLRGEHPLVTALALTIAAAVAIPTLPPFFRRVVRFVAKRKLTATVGQIEEAISWRLFFAGWGWMLLTWSLLGGAFAAIVYAVGLAQQASGSGTAAIGLADLSLAAAAMALAVVAGFVSLLPGGAGVREWVLATVLSPRIGPAGALLAAVLARLTFLVVELLMAALSRRWLKR